jgi:hypothetical protein
VPRDAPMPEIVGLDRLEFVDRTDAGFTEPGAG